MASTPTRQTRPYAARMRPEDRREQLLDAVLAVIVKQGVHKVSIDAVAREAGVTRPVIYGHFEDTNALLRASLAREEAGALEQMAGVLPAVGDGHPGEAAIRSLEAFLAAVQASPDRWRAAFALVDSSTPEFRARLDQGRALAISLFEGLVRWGIDDGALAPETDVEMLARALFALFWDSGRLVLAEPDTFPAERILAFGRQTVRTHLTPR